jgi:hypothetical protein
MMLRSRVVICDCTGRNPNVFYEIGIAHTLGREVILITQNPEDIPFDLRHLRSAYIVLFRSDGISSSYVYSMDTSFPETRAWVIVPTRAI